VIAEEPVDTGTTKQMFLLFWNTSIATFKAPRRPVFAEARSVEIHLFSFHTTLPRSCGMGHLGLALGRRARAHSISAGRREPADPRLIPLERQLGAECARCCQSPAEPPVNGQMKPTPAPRPLALAAKTDWRGRERWALLG
jgi:hypothetical protein